MVFSTRAGLLFLPGRGWHREEFEYEVGNSLCTQTPGQGMAEKEITFLLQQRLGWYRGALKCAYGLHTANPRLQENLELCL